jgi:hypothetical protein
VKPRALLLVVFVVALVVGRAGVARAQDRRAEAAAREALQGAQGDYATNNPDKAITRLTKAIKGCARCSTQVRALLERDLGAIEFHYGDEDGGMEAFVRALALEPNADLTTRYDTPDVRAAWDAAKDEASVAGTPQPSGDFVHTPVPEQMVRTGLPIYAETDAPVAKVTARYKGAAGKEWARLELARVGKGWGAVVPCGDVKQGVVRYYLVGVDAQGSPVVSSGDAKRPFYVRIRPTISTPPPSLPGQAAPKQCAEGAKPPAPPPPEPAAEPGPTPASEAEPEPKTPRKPPRVWVGVAGSFDVTLLPSANDACKLPASDSGYFCTDPFGGDYPPNNKVNAALPAGKAGTVGGGIVVGDVRAMLSLDVVLGSNALVGARVGLVANRYQGSAASQNGRGFGIPLHFEGRFTYVFGNDALVKVGWAPLVFGSAGAAEFDAGTVVQVRQTGIVGDQTVVAWRTGGPWFFGAGCGARYAFSAAMAFQAALKANVAWGGNGAMPVFGPEIGLAYGL